MPKANSKQNLIKSHGNLNECEFKFFDNDKNETKVEELIPKRLLTGEYGSWACKSFWNILKL